MNQQSVQAGNAANKTNDAPEGEGVKKRHWINLDPKYWVESPVGAVLLSVGLTLMSQITPEGSKAKVYLVFAAIWILLGGVLFWVAHGIANRNVPTDDERNKQDKKEIHDELRQLKSEVNSTKEKVEALDKRSLGRKLTENQKSVIIHSLKAFGQSYKICVQFTKLSRDGEQYSRGFFEALKEAGWVETNVAPVECYRDFAFIVNPEDQKLLPPPVAYLIQILLSLGIVTQETALLVNDKIPAGVLVLYCGMAP